MNKRVKNADQTWVVYGHYDGDKLVYLGSGQVHRAFQFIKRGSEHYDWLVEKAIITPAVEFIKILFITDDFEEARFIEGRLIAETTTRFNKTLNKVTFADLSYAKKQMGEGKSLRSCASKIGIAHNNLRVLLKLPYCDTDYNIQL